MRIKFNKEIEFLIKNLLIPEKILLKRRLKRSIKKVDEKELLILEKIVKKELESVDVGVYRGVYTYSLAKLSKHVHSFEPNPLIFPYLKKNLTNLVKNITLYEFALSNIESEANLNIPERYKTIIKNNYEEKYKLGYATIHNKNTLENVKYISHKVKTAKLDNILKNKKIGFIKIDVEGHEMNVLNGSKETIKKNKPNFLIEIEERHSKVKVEETINSINLLGYKSYYTDGVKLMSTNKLSNFSKNNNYIFIP
jgi:FkbM family methyltransferase